MINKIYGEVTYFFEVRDDATAGSLKRLSDWCLTGKGWMPRPQQWVPDKTVVGNKMVDTSFDNISEWNGSFGVDKESNPYTRIHSFCEMPIKYVRTESHGAP